MQAERALVLPDAVPTGKGRLHFYNNVPGPWPPSRCQWPGGVPPARPAGGAMRQLPPGGPRPEHRERGRRMLSGV
jgi:hypothetical protein